MWPDSDFSHPTSSFNQPVEPPDIDPGSAPFGYYRISRAWMPFIRGALTQLFLQSTWKTDVVSLELTQQRVANLFSEISDMADVGCQCVETIAGRVYKFDPTVGSGGTFVQVDPRTDGTVAPPWSSPPVGQTGNCLSGANIAAVFKATMVQMDNGLTAGVLFAGLVDTLVGFLLAVFPPADVLMEIMFTEATAAIAAGAATFHAAFNPATRSDVYDILKCAIEENVAADGSVTLTNIANMKTRFQALMPGSAVGAQITLWETMVGLFLDKYGPNGLMLAGKQGGIVSADCSGCAGPWCVKYDFTLNNGGFTATFGTYVAGQGWQSVVGGGAQALVIFKTIAVCTSTHCQIVYDVTNLKTNDAAAIQAKRSGTLVVQNTSQHADHTSGTNLSAIDPQPSDPSYPLYNVAIDTIIGDLTAYAGGVVTVKSITFWGTGTPPAGEPTC